MEELIQFIGQHIHNFLFILLRTSIFMSMMPVFSSRNHPAEFKLGFAVALALVLTPIVQVDYSQVSIYSVVTREVVLGMALGLSVRFVFFAVTIGGQIMATAMSIRTGAVFDPEYGSAGDVSRLLSAFATLLFFAMDVHHDILYIFVKGFEIVPAGVFNFQLVADEAVAVTSRMFVMALKMALPVLLGSMIINIIIGFMSKAAPQIHLLMVSFPIHILTGLFIIMMSLPLFAILMENYFNEAKQEMYYMLHLAAG